MNLLYVTGNKNKAKFIRQNFDFDFEVYDLSLDEIQSLNPDDIIKHKVIQAYKHIKQPVFVEDTCLFINELGNLPGPFIKFFINELGLNKICDMINNDRSAKAVSTIGYYDGKNLHIFQRELAGQISLSPKGQNGFGWDKIFIINGQKQTNAQLTDRNYLNFYKSLKPFDELKNYLTR